MPRSSLQQTRRSRHVPLLRCYALVLFLSIVCSAATRSRAVLRQTVSGSNPRIAVDRSGGSIVASVVQRTESTSPDGIHIRLQVHFDTLISRLTADGRVSALARFNDADAGPVYLADDGNILALVNRKIVKLDQNGATLWTFTVPGASVNSLALDRRGRIWLTGSAYSDFQPTAGALQGTIRQPCGNDPQVATSDAFLATVSGDGSELLYATFIGGSRADWGTAIAIDSEQNVWVAGNTNSPDFPATTDGLQSRFGGPQDDAVSPSSDGFVLKVDSTGRRMIYGTYLGGSLADRVSALAISDSNSIFVTGTTESPNFPVTANAAAGTCTVEAGRCANAFFARFDSAGNGVFVSYDASVRTDDALADAQGNLWFTGSVRTSDLAGCQPAAQLVKIDARTGAVLERQPILYASNPVTAMDASGRMHIAGAVHGSQAPVFTRHPASQGGSMLQILDLTLRDEWEPRCVVNAASDPLGQWNSMFIAPGEMIAIYGSGLGPPTKVRLAGRELTIAARQNDSILAAVPLDIPFAADNDYSVTSQLTIERDELSETYQAFALSTFAGLFTTDGTRVSALNQDGTLNAATNPARRGSVVSLFATGLGVLDANGQIARPFQVYVEALTETYAAGLEILYAGLAPGLPGVYQVNGRIPEIARTGEVRIKIVFSTSRGAIYWYANTDSIRGNRIFIAP